MSFINRITALGHYVFRTSPPARRIAAASQYVFRGGVNHGGTGELINKLGILYGYGTILQIQTGKGKPIRIKCLYNSDTKLKGRMPTQATIKGLYSLDTHLKCYLDLSEVDYRG